MRLLALAAALATATAAAPALAQDIPGSEFEAGNWYGLAVPAKTATEIIASIRGATLNALRMPETGKALRDLGYVPVGDEPDDFAAHIQSEIDKLARILKDMRTQ